MEELLAMVDLIGGKVLWLFDLIKMMILCFVRIGFLGFVRVGVSALWLLLVMLLSKMFGYVVIYWLMFLDLDYLL